MYACLKRSGYGHQTAAGGLVVAALVAVMLLVPGLAAGQGRADSVPPSPQPAPFASLPGLVEIGDTVRIVEVGGKTRTVKIVGLEPSALTVVVDGQQREYNAATVDRILKTVRDPLWNGALVGMGVGAGLGAFAGYGSSRRAGLAFWTSLGIYTGVAIAIDALINDTLIVYSRGSGKKTFALSPIAAPGVRGVQLTLQW